MLHGPMETSSTIKSVFPSMRVLDLSHNGLVGNLPGKYLQNLNAMKNVCEHPLEPKTEVDGDGDDGDGDEDSGFTWRVVMMGFGCGTVLGLVMGYVMFPTRRPKHDDEEDDIDEALGGGDATREEDGGAMGSRGGRRAIGEGSGSLSSRKRKSVQVTLIDEDDDEFGCGR
ncbi:hypothetical protein L1887_09002 [Cichorium endivia]|nr:hypothetical protein L1887_09002 [Cichorium endivia]